MNDSNRITAIRARCEAARKGPWKDTDGYSAQVFSESARGDCHICDVRGWGYLTKTLGLSEEKAAEQQEADARFISHAREDIPFLLNQLAEKEREIERFQNIINSPDVAYMSSPIGDLPIDSTGMRKAVDEIARLTELHKREVIITGEYAKRVIDLQAEVDRLSDYLLSREGIIGDLKRDVERLRESIDGVYKLSCMCSNMP